MTEQAVKCPSCGSKQLDGFLGKALCAASVTSVTSETKEQKSVSAEAVHQTVKTHDFGARRAAETSDSIYYEYTLDRLTTR